MALVTQADVQNTALGSHRHPPAADLPTPSDAIPRHTCIMSSLEPTPPPDDDVADAAADAAAAAARDKSPPLGSSSPSASMSSNASARPTRRAKAQTHNDANPFGSSSTTPPHTPGPRRQTHGLAGRRRHSCAMCSVVPLLETGRERTTWPKREAPMRRCRRQKSTACSNTETVLRPTHFRRRSRTERIR